MDGPKVRKCKVHIPNGRTKVHRLSMSGLSTLILINRQFSQTVIFNYFRPSTSINHRHVRVVSKVSFGPFTLTVMNRPLWSKTLDLTHLVSFEPRDFTLERNHHWYAFTICIAQYKDWFFWESSCWNFIGCCGLTFAIPFITWTTSSAVLLQSLSFLNDIKIPNLARAIYLLAFECVQTCCFTFRFILTIINTSTQ